MSTVLYPHPTSWTYRSFIASVAWREGLHRQWHSANYSKTQTLTQPGQTAKFVLDHMDRLSVDQTQTNWAKPLRKGCIAIPSHSILLRRLGNILPSLGIAIHKGGKAIGLFRTAIHVLGRLIPNFGNRSPRLRNMLRNFGNMLRESRRTFPKPPNQRITMAKMPPKADYNTRSLFINL